MQSGAGRATTLFPLLLAGLLAGMSYWLDMTSRVPDGANDGKLRHDPDYLIENFEVNRYGTEGTLQSTLSAPLMRHYPDDDSTLIFAPELSYHHTPPTFITAREAHLDSQGKHVELIDDVRVVRGGLDDKPETVLTTSRLDAWPDDELASNNVPVVITQGLSRVEGSSLAVNNKTSIHVLNGPVHGIFEHNDKAPPAAVTKVPLSSPQAKAKAKAKPHRPRTKSKVKR
jgi:lipopolysaccharide export system protein LptC